MTSTPSSASARATRSFSGWVMLQPGDCSPSRRVVSKINTRSGLGVIAVSLSQRILTLRSLLAQPGHAGAQLATDFLDLAILVFLEHPLIVLAAGGAFLDPLLGELARLHFLQNLAHDVLDAVVDDSRTTSEVTVLGGVADELVHLGEASFMEKVDDELQLMEALVVRDLRLIAGLDQRLKALHHELGGAAAQHCLLSEEIRLCLFSERSLQNAAARAADTMRVGEGLSMRLAARILRDRDQTRYATAFLVLPAYQAAGALRCNEDDIQILAGFDLFVVDVEAMREQQGGPFLQALLDFLVERLLGEIGHEHRNEVSSSGSIRGLCDFETIFLGLFPARSFLAHPHHDVEPTVLQVQCMRAPLASIAQHRDERTLQGLLVDILLRIQPHYANSQPPTRAFNVSPNNRAESAASSLARGQKPRFLPAAQKDDAPPSADSAASSLARGQKPRFLPAAQQR